MAGLREIIEDFRRAAVTEREKGTYFEELVLCYLRNEATYRDYYNKVWRYADWAEEQGLDKRDVGIDLVAQTAGTNEFHAIQCKLYAEDHVIRKEDIDSFFTASGKRPFTHRIIVCSTNHWSEHAEEALRDQQIVQVSYLPDTRVAGVILKQPLAAARCPPQWERFPGSR